MRANTARCEHDESADTCTACVFGDLAKRDATIADLTARLAEARAALLAYVRPCPFCRKRAVTRRGHDWGGLRAACCDACEIKLRAAEDVPHAPAIRAAEKSRKP